MRKLLASLAIAASMVVGTAGIASAHHNTITGRATCQQDGTYSVVWSVVNSETDKTEVITASSRAVVPVGSSFSAGQTRTFTESVPGSTSGLGLTLSARWSNGVTNTNSGSATGFGEGCRPTVQTFPFRLRIQMMNHAGPIIHDGTFDALPGSAVKVVLTRAPKYFKVRIYSESTLVSAGKYAASPRSQVHVVVGSIDVRDFARLAGRAPQTYTYHGIV